MWVRIQYSFITSGKKKPNETDGIYQVVQHLREVNKIVKDIYPVVDNPYTLPTKLQDNQVWFTVLNLKDAFFCLPLTKESQNLFAFE